MPDVLAGNHPEDFADLKFGRQSRRRHQNGYLDVGLPHVVLRPGTEGNLQSVERAKTRGSFDRSAIREALPALGYTWLLAPAMSLLLVTMGVAVYSLRQSTGGYTALTADMAALNQVLSRQVGPGPSGFKVMKR